MTAPLSPPILDGQAGAIRRRLAQQGETTIYATPEIQAEREELAPADPYLREGIPHIAETSERDRAQRAAHDEALRSELRALPAEELGE